MKKINKIILEKQKEGKISVTCIKDDSDLSYMENHYFDIYHVDGYYLIVNISSNKTIKVCESEELVIEFLEELFDGAKIIKK